MKSFCESYNLTSQIKQLISFKNYEKPSCIDLILTNKPKSFQRACVMETGLSDFHRLYLYLKCNFENFHQSISYKDFCNHDNANFINSLNEVLCENENTESFLKDPDFFVKLRTEVLNKHAPRKKKHVRASNKSFMNS